MHHLDESLAWKLLETQVCKAKSESCLEEPYLRHEGSLMGEGLGSVT